MSDNWKTIRINHPKKGLVTIKSLSNNDKGRAIVDLSNVVAKTQSQNVALNGAIQQLYEIYANHILSIAVMSDKERNELFK